MYVSVYVSVYVCMYVRIINLNVTNKYMYVCV